MLKKQVWRRKKGSVMTRNFLAQIIWDKIFETRERNLAKLIQGTIIDKIRETNFSFHMK